MVTQGELSSILAFATAGRINEKHKQTIKSNTIFGLALRFICSKFEDNDWYAVLATILGIFYAMNTVSSTENKWEHRFRTVPFKKNRI